MSMLPPYNYNRLCRALKEKEERFCEKGVRVEYVHSLLNNAIPIIFIEKKFNEKKDKGVTRNYVILGRHHPGEVWSSFLVD